MKYPALLGLTAAAFLAGCATPLTKETDVQRFAEIIRVPRTDVQFISYCTFAETRGWDDHAVFTEGIVAVTSAGLHVLGGNLNNASSKREIVLSNQQISGIDLRHYGRGRQLHLWSGDHILVLEITANKAFVDQAGSEQVLQMFRTRGIPQKKSDHYFKGSVPPILFVPIPLK